MQKVVYAWLFTERALLNNDVKSCSKIWQSLSNNQHCRFRKTLYLTKDVSCVVTRWIWEPETKAFDMVNNFIFIILKVRSEVNGIYMLEDCLSLNSLNYIKHWLTKCDWTLLLQLYGVFQVYADLLKGHICNSTKQMKYKYLREWTEMAFKHKPFCHSILKLYLLTNLSSVI